MTMNNVEVEELLNVLEEIRSDKYPDIPSEVIKSIVEAQFENQDDRAEGNRKTKRLIDSFLNEVVPKD